MTFLKNGRTFLMNKNKEKIRFGEQDLIPEGDLSGGTWKKTVYLDDDVLSALKDEAKRRGQKKVMPLVNQILRETLMSEGKTIEQRVRLLEEKVFG